MESPAPQASPWGAGASQRVTASPPETGIFFSLPSAAKAIHAPSGEKIGLSPPSVPAKGVASN